MKVKTKKKCTKCKELKPLDEFYKRKEMSDGYRSECKSCYYKIVNQRYVDNLSPEGLIKYNHNKKGKKKRKKLLKKGKYICSRCGETKNLTEFYKNSINCHGYSYFCKDCENKRLQKCRDKMKQDLKWVKHRNERKRKYWSKIKDDPQVKLNSSISFGIYHSLKGNKNGKHWEELVGYTLGDLKQHLEKQFDDKMTWKNYGKYWHLDHVVPISTWNYTKPEHIGFKKCWALSNLQPLEASDNMRKHNKLIKAKQEYLMI